MRVIVATITTNNIKVLDLKKDLLQVTFVNIARCIDYRHHESYTICMSLLATLPSKLKFDKDRGIGGN